MRLMKKKIYIVAGPTASGKTKLAIDLAIHKKGEIIKKIPENELLNALYDELKNWK